MITPAERATPLLAVAGPTAVGKSAAVIALAGLLERDGANAVLISADSRQVFRGFDIGTDKLPAQVLAARPHAGIDVAEADQPFTLYDWLAVARDAAAADAVANASPRRVLRALEIAQLGGDSMATEEEPWSGPSAYVLLDEPDLAAHRTKIAERAAAQFAGGLVAEAKALAARLPGGTPALSGIGYREALQYLAGEISEEKAVTHSSGR
ncbi:MAG: hypothetical protein ACKN98_02410, partial [Candidatus Limnocylindrus sp.]